MNAAEIANSISVGVHALANLRARLASSNTARTHAAELAGDLLTLIPALEARGASDGTVDDVRRLHAVVVQWRDTGLVSPEIGALADKCLAALRAPP